MKLKDQLNHPLDTITLKTTMGTILGNAYEDACELLAVPYAKAKRFAYCETIDSYEEIIDGRTMLPIRFVAENLGFKVEWDESTQTVTVTG